MVIVGLALLALTGAFTGLLISENWAGGPDYTVSMFGNTLGTLTSLQIFLAGIALTLVFCAALAMTVFGVRRTRRRSREARLATARDAEDPLAAAHRGTPRG